MKKLIVAMQMTLDGYISGAKGESDWLLSDNEEWNDLFIELDSVDTILVGRNMYSEYVQHWRAVLKDASADVNERKYAQRAHELPHIVFSRTMTDAGWDNARIARDAATEVKKLKQSGGKNMLLWGGATLAAELINLNLVDELRIELNPIILGSGLSLFKNIKDRHRLSAPMVRCFPSGLVLLKYTLKN
jgi:dihydrofolate reductase